MISVSRLVTIYPNLISWRGSSWNYYASYFYLFYLCLHKYTCIGGLLGIPLYCVCVKSWYFKIYHLLFKIKKKKWCRWTYFLLLCIFFNYWWLELCIYWIAYLSNNFDVVYVRYIYIIWRSLFMLSLLCSHYLVWNIQFLNKFPQYKRYIIISIFRVNKIENKSL